MSTENEDRVMYVCPADESHDTFVRLRIAYDEEMNTRYGEATDADGEFFYPNVPVKCAACDAIAIVMDAVMVEVSLTIWGITRGWECTPAQAQAFLKEHRYGLQEWLNEQQQSWLAQHLPFPKRRL